MHSKEITKEGYYPEWLTNAECGNEYKRKLIDAYEDYFNEQDKIKRKQKLDKFRIYLTVVADVVAYRYLVKYYSNLFYKLSITVEEYIEYKVERMYVTVRDKKDKINDIMSYVYMSFMLSSPRLIYDYGEYIGRCKTIREIQPYYKTQRLKFYFIEKDTAVEHIVYVVDNLDLDNDTEAIRSNLEKYSLSQYVEQQQKQNIDSGFDLLREFLDHYPFQFKKSEEYLLNIFDNWKTKIEDDFEDVKQELGIKSNNDFNLLDYIEYKYENKQIDLNYDEYVDVLNALNNILKGRRKK